MKTQNQLQWDQIGYFWKLLVTNFVIKVGQQFGNCAARLFWKMLWIFWKLVWKFLWNLWKNLGYLLFQHLVTLNNSKLLAIFINNEHISYYQRLLQLQGFEQKACLLRKRRPKYTVQTRLAFLEQCPICIVHGISCWSAPRNNFSVFN